MLKWLWEAITAGHIAGFGRFTDRSRLVMRMANHLANQQAAQCTAPEHILLSILDEGDGVGVALLQARRISVVPSRQYAMSCRKQHSHQSLRSPTLPSR